MIVACFLFVGRYQNNDLQVNNLLLLFHAQGVVTKHNTGVVTRSSQNVLNVHT
jgi:hypothetical protein